MTDGLQLSREPWGAAGGLVGSSKRYELVSADAQNKRQTGKIVGFLGVLVYDIESFFATW
jgi:hypothetical protein